MIAEWRIVPGFEDYEVSEWGAVRRVTAAPGARIGKILKMWIRSDGYPMVILRKDGKSIHKKAHQLVAYAFIGLKPFDGAEICHIDGDPSNNHYSNLRWDTRSSNHLDKRKHGTSLMGERHHNAVLSVDDVRKILSLWKSGKFYQRQLGEMFGVKQTQIGRIVRGKRWAVALQNG